MARLASQATAGYFPTPEHLLPAIASLVALDAADRPVLLDPCAGTGSALLRLASTMLDLHPSKAASYCQGIEMEATRAKALAHDLPYNAAHRGDAFTFAITAAPGASFLFLNPPYDHDSDHRRLEERFLLRFTQALAPGGALLFLVPHGSLAASAETLASHYSELRVFRFPDADFAAFRQVVLVARRRHERTPPDPATVARLQAAAADAGLLPPLPAAGVEAPLRVEISSPYLTLSEQSLDIPDLLSRARPFAACTSLLGYDRDARELLSQPMTSALPPRPAHIALSLAGGLLNGRQVQPNDDCPWLPPVLAKGTFTRSLLTVDERRDKKGRVTGEVCVQQPRLDMHVLRLDTGTFHQLALGTEPSGATDLDDFNTADLLEHYGDDLTRIVREQIPPLHDPDDPAHQIPLPKLARTPFRIQSAAIQAGLKLLAQGENPQAVAEVGTGKTTVALFIAAALFPEHIETTARGLTRVGIEPKHLRPVHRVLVVCPPHLLDSWTDQVRAVLPEASVQVVRSPSDLDRPATVYVLSRETAKLGSKIAGVSTSRCPDCGHPLPEGSRSSYAAKRVVCTGEIFLPVNPAAHVTRDLALALARYAPQETRDRLLPYLTAHPAAHRRLRRLHRDAEPAGPLPAAPSALRTAYQLLLDDVERNLVHAHQHERNFWSPVQLAGQVALLLDDVEAFAKRCRDLASRRSVSTDYGPSVPQVLKERLEALQAEHARLQEAGAGERNLVLAQLFDGLLNVATWRIRTGCGAPLYAYTPQPRRYPLARYIQRRRRHHFDLLILDEAHEFSTKGSAQQKAAHRLVQLPGVPTLALTGSLMGGYASSLFPNAWALSPRVREQFGPDDQSLFITAYGYRKLLVTSPESDRLPSVRSYGTVTDREARVQVRRLGEAPGVLPLFTLQHVLPTGLIMHKSDLDEELPPCNEEPVAVSPTRDQLLDAKLIAEFNRLRSALVRQIREDRGSDRAGLLWGAMSELPSYLDLASEDCGAFTVAYPEDAGGHVIATGASFPSSWRSPKERWFLETLREELDAGRRVLVFLRHTGNRGFVQRLQRLLQEDLAEPSTFLDVARVKTAQRERWLDQIIEDGCRVLFVHPKAVQTGLNNLVAFPTAVWYEGPDYDARVTRQANGRPHRIGQTLPVRLLYPYYDDTLQKSALDLVARKITASLQVDGLSLAGALEAAGAMTDEDQLHASAALAIGQALYRAATEST